MHPVSLERQSNVGAIIYYDFDTKFAAYPERLSRFLVKLTRGQKLLSQLNQLNFSLA
jgi:hypothetical protein